MAPLTAEQAYKAGKEDAELAASRAAYTAWATGKDCTEAQYREYLNDELTRLFDERIRRGELEPLQQGRAA